MTWRRSGAIAIAADSRSTPTELAGSYERRPVIRTCSSAGLCLFRLKSGPTTRRDGRAYFSVDPPASARPCAAACSERKIRAKELPTLSTAPPDSIPVLAETSRRTGLGPASGEVLAVPTGDQRSRDRDTRRDHQRSVLRASQRIGAGEPSRGLDLFAVDVDLR